MDLALELGMTVGQLTDGMAIDELAGWVKYANKRSLPTRRVELYLAQIAQVTAGGRLADFLILDAREPEAPATTQGVANALGATTGRKVHYIKRIK